MTSLIHCKRRRRRKLALCMSSSSSLFYSTIYIFALLPAESADDHWHVATLVPSLDIFPGSPLATFSSSSSSSWRHPRAIIHLKSLHQDVTRRLCLFFMLHCYFNHADFYSNLIAPGCIQLVHRVVCRKFFNSGRKGHDGRNSKKALAHSFFSSIIPRNWKRWLLKPLHCRVVIDYC